jgi:hypothetical protein
MPISASSERSSLKTLNDVAIRLLDPDYVQVGR